MIWYDCCGVLQGHLVVGWVQNTHSRSNRAETTSCMILRPKSNLLARSSTRMSRSCAFLSGMYGRTKLGHMGTQRNQLSCTNMSHVCGSLGQTGGSPCFMGWDWLHCAVLSIELLFCRCCSQPRKVHRTEPKPLRTVQEIQSKCCIYVYRRRRISVLSCIGDHVYRKVIKRSHPKKGPGEEITSRNWNPCRSLLPASHTALKRTYNPLPL